MPGNIRRIAWITRDGKRRRIRLYEVWVNLRGRITGGKSRAPYYWNGLQNEFYSWERFREWALANGYRKGMQLDRIRSYEGYTPDNCQFLTAADHAAKSSRSHRVGCACGFCLARMRRVHTANSDALVPEPLPDPDVPF